MTEEDKYEDPKERRNLRFEYRKLISDTEQNRHELVQPESTGLHQALKKCGELFPKVRRTREAALDSQFLVLVSNLGREQAQHLQTGIVTFEPRTFAEKLITFMGGRHVGEEADEESENQLRRLEAGDWAKLENAVANSWRRTPTIEFMHGPVSMDAPVKKVRDGAKRRSGDKPGASERVTPEQLVRVENNNEEATTKEVQRVLEALDRVTYQGPDEDPKPVSFFKFVTNPQSFSQTVENIFHLSFLINKGNACIELDNDDLPVVYPTEPYSEQDYEEVINRNQVVMPFTMDDWKNIKQIYQIKTPMIATRRGSGGQKPSQEEDEDMDED